MAGIEYTLKAGGAPLAADVVAAVRRVEVEDHADLADMVRLELAIEVRADGSGWSVLDTQGLFARLQDLRVEVTVGSGQVEPLIDARVIESRASFSNEPGRSVVRVVGMDPTVLLHLEEKVRPWPNMADSDIASAIFGEYGFTPDVKATQPARQDVEVTTIQRGTDMQLLRSLAERNGYECFVELDPASGRSAGHFHPPRLQQSPQGVLSVNLGEATNVEGFSAGFDMLGPTTAEAKGLDTGSASDQKVQVTGSALKGLGTAPAAPADKPRRVLVSRSGLSKAAELQTYAQALVDRSAWAIAAEGELDTVTYGSVLRAKRVVMVRGAGRVFSGAYYVERVLHVLTPDGYRQRFALRRNALGVKSGDGFTGKGAAA